MPIQSKQQPPYYKQGTNTKEYIAYAGQTATDNPTTVILKNTYVTPIIITRDAAGQYYIENTNDEFTEGKTIMPPFGDNGLINLMIGETDTDTYAYNLAWSTTQRILLTTFSKNYTPTEMSTALGVGKLLIHIITYK